MKTNRKKMLLSSIAMLLVALVALGSATYAWFSSNKKVTADGMTVQAAAAKGLQITIDNGSTWGATKTFSPLGNIVFTPVSLALTNAAGTAYAAAPSGDNDAAFYPGEVEKQGGGAYTAAETALFKDWTAITGTTLAGKKPAISGEAKSTPAANAANYFQSYEVGVKSTGEEIKNVAMTATFTKDSTNGKNADQYIRIAVYDLGTSATDIDYTATAPTAILGLEDTAANRLAISATTPSTTTQKIENSLTYSATIDVQAEHYYSFLMWYEGQDPDCTDANQSALGSLKVEFEAP